MSDEKKAAWKMGVLAGAMLCAGAQASDIIGVRVMFHPQASVVPALKAARVTVTGAIETSLPKAYSPAGIDAYLRSLRADPNVLWAQAITSGEAKEKAAAGPVIGKRLYVKLKSSGVKRFSEADWNARLADWSAAQGVALNTLRQSGADARVLELAAETDLSALAKAIESDASVLYADPVVRMYPLRAPTDPMYSLQWNLHDSVGSINAPAAWDITTGGPVTVAVVDTGLLYAHPDLAAKALPGYDMISDPDISLDGDGRDSNAEDTGDWIEGPQCGSQDPIWEASSWHGSHVAGIIGAVPNNDQGISGVSWGARILPVRVLGRCGGEFTDVADGIMWAAGVPVAGAPVNPFPAKVMNMSLGGKGECPRAMQQAIDAALARGTAVVVAAGNSNKDAAGFAPANCGGVITVASHTVNGDKAYYSNFGSLVALSAPGGEFWSLQGILSTISSGPRTALEFTYAEYQGTSMAAPHVTGVAALAYGLNPYLTPGQLSNLLTSTARKFPAGSTCGGNTPCGAGMLDAAAAVAAVPAGATPSSYGTVPVREYYNSALNHYFITASTTEMSAIEAGHMGASWSATGYSFLAYPAGSTAPSNSWPVCRFYGTPGVGPNSHFYTVNPYECAAVSRDDGWWYEGLVFNVLVPEGVVCEVNSQPIYRAYNGRWAQNDSNHRYMTSVSEYQRMLSLGWQGEGVVMCAAPDIQTNSAR